jgi:hypothetical protein
VGGLTGKARLAGHRAACSCGWKDRAVWGNYRGAVAAADGHALNAHHPDATPAFVTRVEGVYR